MKNGITKITFLIFFLTTSFSASAQTSGGGLSNYFLTALVAIAALILITVILQVADNLLRIEAKQIGADKTGANYSVFPKSGELMKPKLPKYASKESVKVLKKGHDILLEGAPESKNVEVAKANTFGVQPTDFIGIAPIPKMLVEVGDTVKAGDPLFFDKVQPDIKYVAPVSGEVVDVKRGEKRAITEVVILKDKDMQYRSLSDFDLENGSREALVQHLMDCGIWTMIRQRPYNVTPKAADLPKNIFISTFDTAPLAPDSNVVIAGREADFQKGLDVLNKLTQGHVYLGLNGGGSDDAPAAAFTEATGVEKSWFSGPHPAGNVGVQIHHTAPINAGEKVWTLGVQEVISLGAVFTEKRFDASRVIVLAGAELETPKYVQTHIGAKVSDLMTDNTVGDNVRYISGDVLSGKQTSNDGYLGYFDDQITVIKEGNYHEMFGWLLPITPRPSVSNTFPNFLFPSHKFEVDTNTHGEKRAFVVTGQYEKVMPMDIYVQHLMKSIIVNDFERMEGLGIYELVEEDVALCEFVCTSKQPLQNILREGLDVMREQG